MKPIKLPFLAIRQGDIPRPMMLVELHSRATGKMIKTWALIDTGADECAFPAVFAQIIGIDLTSGIVRTSGTAGGVTPCYAHKVVIKTDTNHHGITFPEAEISFMPQLRMPLLGVKSFLSYFTVSIDYENSQFVLTPNAKCSALLNGNS